MVVGRRARERRDGWPACLDERGAMRLRREELGWRGQRLLRWGRLLGKAVAGSGLMSSRREDLYFTTEKKEFIEFSNRN